MNPGEWTKILHYLSLVTGIGITFIASVLLGWYAGSALGGAWVLVGILAGIISGILSVYAMLRKFLSRE